MPESVAARWSVFRRSNLNATGLLIQSGATWLRGLTLYNAGVGDRFVKFYNTATAPTVGTDTPVMTLLLLAGTTLRNRIRLSDLALHFSLGLGVGATTEVADSGTTNPATNDVLLTCWYVPAV